MFHGSFNADRNIPETIGYAGRGVFSKMDLLSNQFGRKTYPFDRFKSADSK